jgi:hypothetical protein
MAKSRRLEAGLGTGAESICHKRLVKGLAQTQGGGDRANSQPLQVALSSGVKHYPNHTGELADVYTKAWRSVSKEAT